MVIFIATGLGVDYSGWSWDNGGKVPSVALQRSRGGACGVLWITTVKAVETSTRQGRNGQAEESNTHSISAEIDVLHDLVYSY